MYVNWKQREIDLKVVYYGPPLSGKTTNLEKVHERMVGPRRSKLISLKTEGDRTLFFDFLPLELGEIAGLTPRINLYTVPGQSLYRDTRRLILEEVDGIVFVADSQQKRLADNERSLQEMKRHLNALGFRWFDVPLVLQYNKRDLADLSSVAMLQRRLNPDGSLPHYTSAALEGEGVIETLKHIINLVLVQVQRQFSAT